MSGPREIYVAERAGEVWGNARHLFTGMYPTTTLGGTLYYTEITGRPDYGVLVHRKPKGEGFGDIELVPEAARDTPTSVNTSAVEGHPYVSPDGCTLIFDSMRQPNAGLYVNFRDDEGNWGDAHSLGKRLGIPAAAQGALSPDGRYLFFCLAGDMWWVDASFLAELARH